jgi:WD40 repeat protein
MLGNESGIAPRAPLLNTPTPNSGMSLWGARAPATTTTSNAQEADVELVDPPSDSISCIAFSPATHGEFLAVGAWDNTVCVFMSDILFIYTVNPFADASHRTLPHSTSRFAFMR